MTSCALVAACEFNLRDFRRCWESGAFDYIVAVDGGLKYLEELACIPGLLLGDFDSLGYVPEGDNVEVHPRHKDKSDLELAFDFAFESGFDTVRVYGALGGRLDHTVSNMQMCARFAEAGMDICLVGLDSVLKILVGPGEYKLPRIGKGTVSVFSAVDESQGVSEFGMEYALSNVNLSNRTSLGLSNEYIGKPASVQVESGTLYIFHPLDV